jgi:hypothetical protein
VRIRGWIRALALVFAVLVSALAATAAAGAIRIRALAPVRISGASPFPAACGSAAHTAPSNIQRGAEVEPSLAIDPLDPTYVVAAYQQDRLKVGNSLGNVVSVSTNGGHTFHQRLLTGTTACEGGTPVTDQTPVSVGTDPEAAIGPDGIAYVSTQRDDGYVVSFSTDRGREWQTHVASATPLWLRGTAIPLLYFDDKDSLAADPRRPGRVYLVWDQFTGLQPATILPAPVADLADVIEQVAFVGSTSGARAWSARSIPYFGIPIPYAQDFPALVALPDGELVLLVSVVNDVYALGVQAQPVRVFALRSFNGGASWSSPVLVANVPPNRSGVHDPGTGACIRTGGDCNGSGEPGIVAAAGADGSVDVVWQQELSNTSGGIMLSRSADGGAHWSQPRMVTKGTQEFLPEVAVMPNGTIGVSYDSFRPYARGAGHLYTDVWLAASQDRGRTFSRPVRLAGPFDFRQAPQSITENVGRFLGDYQGMVAFRDGFGVDFAASAPMARFGLSDVFFSRAVLGPARHRRHRHR